MSKPTRKNSKRELTSTQINALRNKLQELNLTQKNFCEQYNINYDAFRTGLSTTKFSQKIAVIVLDFINNKKKKSTEPAKDDIYTIVNKISQPLYKQITNPINVFLALSYKDDKILAEKSNKIIEDAIKEEIEIISVTGLENEKTNEYIVVIVIRGKNRDKFIDVCNKYVKVVE